MCGRLGIIKLKGVDIFLEFFDWGLQILTLTLSLLIKNDIFPFDPNNYNLRNCLSIDWM